MYPRLLPLWSFVILVCLIALGSTSFHGHYILNVAHATTGSDNMLVGHENAITASISRRLAYPDFTDDEKVGAITLLGSAEIDKHSGTINIPARSESRKSSIHNASVSWPLGSSPQIHSSGIQPAPTNWSNMAGRALYSFPFRMLDPVSNTTASFHTTFSFRMHNATTKDGNTSAINLHASDGGLTFLVVPDELTVGRNGGWLGMMNDACDDDYRPFAIEFDTFKNEEFQDPNDHHVGINYGSIISHQTADIAKAGISLREGAPVRAWISYDSSKHLVDVRLATDGSTKPVEPLLSVPLDLSNIFKEYMFVGFSGGASGSFGHSILSWHFSSDSTGLLRFPKQESCATRLLPKLKTQSKKPPNAFIIFCLVILIVGFALLNFACIPYKKKNNDMPSAVKLLRLAREKPRALHKPRQFSLQEVLEASRMFNEGEILGNGKRGVYYRGFLQDSTQVAIKRFSSSYLRQAINTSSDKKRLEKEMYRLAQVHHPNIVPLRGWCFEKEEVLLAYEYIPNGSLDQWLFSQASIFPWIRRYKIVKEIAEALSFLHSSFEKPIVHKNVKLSNVLLDITFRAKLGDYGLLNRLTQTSSMKYSTNKKSVLKINVASRRPPLSDNVDGCMGLPWSKRVSSTTTNQAKSLENASSGETDMEVVESPRRQLTATYMIKGCMPQAMMSEINKREAHESKTLTQEDDVFSYGVMLFEIACGRMDRDGRESDLVEWVWSLHEQGMLMDAIDEDLKVGASRYYTWEEEAACVLSIGLLCTLQDPSLRPSMDLVTKYLHGEISLPKVPLRRSLLSASTMGDGNMVNSLVIYPELSDDCGSSEWSPPLKTLHHCSSLQLSCLSTSARAVAP